MGDLLDNHLLANSTSEESKVFFNKMKGDYHRYMAEYSTNEARENAAEEAAAAYKVAEEIAGEHIPPLIHFLVLHLTTLFSCMKLLMLQKKHALLQNKLLIWLFLNLI